jgi:undecaprenyl-diphosphatase
MDNLHLFELINAPPGLSPLRLLLAMALAHWSIYCVPLGLALAWSRGSLRARAELMQMLVAMLIALGVAQILAHTWPQAGPFALHMGTQYLPQAHDSGLPSHHVTVFWSLALSALGTRRFAVWGFPLLALGLLAGFSRVYLGVHFPADVVAALPVALVGAVMAHALRARMLPLTARVLYVYDRWSTAARARLHRARKAG